MERTSLFLGRGARIEPIRRYHDGPAELGLGAAYNYFTRWIGYPSYQDAGKVMGMAGHGQRTFPGVRIFDRIPGKYTCRIRPDQDHRPEAVRELLELESGREVGPGGGDVYNPTQLQKDVALLVQDELEAIEVAIVRDAIESTGVSNLCIAGGVGLNCVANSRLLQDAGVRRLFVQPASGDEGQAVGNALWGYRSLLGGTRGAPMRGCSWGRTYSSKEVTSGIESFGSRILSEIVEDPADRAARLLSEGRIVGLFAGGSEFGPRALGHRSLLGDPRTIETKHRLDREVKKREPYRPYAPSVLGEHLEEWFDLSGGLGTGGSSPLRYMLLAVPVRPERAPLVPAVVHADGTSRLQVVEREENPAFHRLISAFHRLTGVPMVLNTSFNSGVEPIVESPEDAIKSFLSMGFDALILEDRLVTRG